jgi:hypothetical protein
MASSIGCSTPSTPAPTPTPSHAILAVSGSVSDVLSRRVANVRIEVVSGPQEGTVTFSDESGNFAIEPKLSSMSQVRASKPGYVDSTQTVVGTGPTVDLRFLLSSANQPLDWSGTYEVTLIADATCTELPDLVRRRTFTGTVTAGGNPMLRLSGARFGSSGGLEWNVMPFRQFDDYVELYAQDPPIAELLTENTLYMLYGDATGTVTRDSARLDVFGGISYCPKIGAGDSVTCDSPLITCVSNQHQVTMTRR